MVPSKLYETHEQFMIGVFIDKINPIEKTGSLGKSFIWPGNVIIFFFFL